MKTSTLLATIIALSLSFPAGAAPVDRLARSRFSVNFQNADVSNLLRLVAAQTGLQLKADQNLAAFVTLSQQNATAREILDRLSQDQEIEYSVEGNTLYVSKRAVGVPGASGSVHHVSLKFANATDVAVKLQSIVPVTEKVIVDDTANSIMFVGSDLTWQKVSQVVGYLDVVPAQVMIEAQIVEMSNTFLRDLGVELGGGTPNGKHNVSMNNPLASLTPNLTYSGLVSGKAFNLDVKLNAAESRGEAKVISRPKVMTLNNKKAKIESGLSINVKTLSTAISNPKVNPGDSSTGTEGLAATSGVTTIQAGLTLEILPTIVESDLLRLNVNIANNQPDESEKIDGIPTVHTNSAATSILVRSGETAIIAGLIKQTNAKSEGGVPVLSSIPLLGGLFGSTSRTDRNNELTIFITPTIENGHIVIKPSAQQGAAPAPTAAELKPAG